MGSVEFVAVEVEPDEGWPDGWSLRFKAASPVRPIARVRYEAEDGTEGWWRVFAATVADERRDAAPAGLEAARCALVEDSSEGTVLLIVGGARGLLLEHEASGARVREPYLLLSAATPVDA